MPTYEYRCKACGHEFEEFQSITAPVLKKCPACAKLKLERLIGTGSAVMFKGGGFYETDYRSESYKKAAKADAEGAKGASDTPSKPDARPETKSEPKPASKAEPKPASKPDSSPGTKPTKKGS